uniref:Membrane protein, putative n=1 Tax=Theileria annulata TaxID=5874 RepID=A0A3B0MP62_THEAN
MTRVDLSRRLKVRSYLKCLFYVLGIYVCFLSFGYFLEKLLKFKYEENRVYSFPIFVVVITTFSNLLMSSALLLIHHNKTTVLSSRQSHRNLKHPVKFQGSSDESWKTSSTATSDSTDKLEVTSSLFSVLEKKHLIKLSISSSFCVLAQMTSTCALRHVGTPTQVVIKSSKMVPILIGGYLLFKKKYAWYDVSCVICVTLSLILFNYDHFVNYKSNKNSVFGIFMCFLSLVCDAFVGPIQDDVLSKVDVHPHVLMFITNFVSLPVSFLVCFLTEGLDPFYILFKHRYILRLVFFLAVSGSLGQLFVFLCIKTYGSLYTGIITTLRKAFTTLLSVYIFKHKMTQLQWFSLTLTFSSIFFQQFFKNKSKKSFKSK